MLYCGGVARVLYCGGVAWVLYRGGVARVLYCAVARVLYCGGVARVLYWGAVARVLYRCTVVLVFQAMLVQLNASECLLPTGDGADRLRPVIERSGLLITDRKKGDIHMHINARAHTHTHTHFQSKQNYQFFHRASFDIFAHLQNKLVQYNMFSPS